MALASDENVDDERSISQSIADSSLSDDSLPFDCKRTAIRDAKHDESRRDHEDLQQQQQQQQQQQPSQSLNDVRQTQMFEQSGEDHHRYLGRNIPERGHEPNVPQHVIVPVNTSLEDSSSEQHKSQQDLSSGSANQSRSMPSLSCPLSLVSVDEEPENLESSPITLIRDFANEEGLETVLDEFATVITQTNLLQYLLPDASSPRQTNRRRSEAERVENDDETGQRSATSNNSTRQDTSNDAAESNEDQVPPDSRIGEIFTAVMSFLWKAFHQIGSQCSDAATSDDMSTSNTQRTENTHQASIRIIPKPNSVSLLELSMLDVTIASVKFTQYNQGQETPPTRRRTFKERMKRMKPSKVLRKLWKRL